jgi:hypothetical protein
MKVPFILPFIFLVIVGIVVFLYESQINKVFGGSLGKANCFLCKKINYNGYLTNWTVSHFAVFLIVGFLCPTQIYTFIGIGILWEFIELYLEYTSKFNKQSVLCDNIVECNSAKISKTDFWHHFLGIRDNKISIYWNSGGLVGSLLDIVADILGLVVGRYLSLYF